MKRKDLVILAVFLAVVAVLPLVAGNRYVVNILVFMALNAAIATGLNLFAGYAGQISLGHAAFYGIGAYATGVLTVRLGVPPVLAGLAGMALSGLVAWLIALPALRLHGHYLAMATLGFGIIVQIVFNEWAPVTAGPSGLSGIPGFSLGGLRVENVNAYYYIAWAFFAAVFLFSLLLVRSRTGLVLRAVRHDERFAAASGIPVAYTKIATFVVSAVVASMAGSLYAHYVRFISPETFGFNYSIFLVTVIVVGGMSTVWGPLVGAVLLTVLPEVLRFAKDYDVVVYGLVLVLSILFNPRGLAVKMKLD